MKHGWSCPAFCSQCAAFPNVRRVTLTGPTLTIDGAPTAKHEPDRSYYVRGGKRRRPRQ